MGSDTLLFLLVFVGCGTPEPTGNWEIGGVEKVQEIFLHHIKIKYGSNDNGNDNCSN